jgi:pyrimidine operon attenuation protein/uracil phosphoribosyltransferase
MFFKPKGCDKCANTGFSGRRAIYEMLLVDDVAFTGRTVRAALDALSDFGRPSAIRLAVLVDRGGRELPIQPDFCALNLKDLPRERHVQVSLVESDGKDEIAIT